MSGEWKRIILHADMDAFFAAVEQLCHPELRGKPVIVGADPRQGKGRGVVSTASYEARRFGVHSAMPISQAYRLCPHGIYLPPNGRLYGQYARRVFKVLEEYSPLVQKISIDEAFIDLSGHPDFRNGLPVEQTAGKLAQRMKKQILDQTGLTASVGIAPSKSVAKIASDYDKPDGLTIVAPGEVQAFLDPLPVGRLWGVGKKSAEVLKRQGIETVAQLRQCSKDYLDTHFGKMGNHLLRMATGTDDREVHIEEEIKSVSHETTFEEDQTDRDLLKSTLLYLSEMVAARLRHHKMRGRTVQLKLRFSDFSTFTRHKSLPDYTHMTEEIFAVANRLFEQFADHTRPVRLIGVGVSQLAAEAGLQMNLWEGENARKLQLEKVLDSLQQKYGKSALTHAETLTARRRGKKSGSR